jgi:hypothetical protein
LKTVLSENNKNRASLVSIGSTTADVSKKNLQSQEKIFKDEASNSTNLKIYPS